LELTGSLRIRDGQTIPVGNVQPHSTGNQDDKVAEHEVFGVVPEAITVHDTTADGAGGTLTHGNSTNELENGSDQDNLPEFLFGFG
jgi:hypothetical protein